MLPNQTSLLAFVSVTSAQSSMAPRRPRFEGSSQNDRRLYSVVREYMTTPTKIEYGETLTSKFDALALKKHGRFLWSLRDVQPNCSFKKKQMRVVMFNLARERREQWKFNEADMIDFAERVGERVRAMATHLGAALRRQNVPRWAKQILEMSEDGRAVDAHDATGPALDEEEEGGQLAPPIQDIVVDVQSDDEKKTDDDQLVSTGCDDQLEECDKSLAEQNYFVGFEPDLDRAWRTPADFDIVAKDFTQGIRVPAEASPSDVVVAHWPDGYAHELSSVTVAMWTAKKEAALKSRSWLWHGHGYIVKEKADRGALVYLATVDNRSKQLCQMKVDHMPSKDAATEVLAEVANKLSEGYSTYPTPFDTRP